MDNELLLAIAKLLQPIREDIQALRGDMTELKREVTELKKEVTQLKKEVTQLKRDLIILEQRVDKLEQKINEIKIQVEIEIMPRLQTIEKCYTDTYYRYQNQVEGYEQMQSDIKIMQNVLQDHSKKIHLIPNLA